MSTNQKRPIDLNARRKRRRKKKMKMYAFLIAALLVIIAAIWGVIELLGSWFIGDESSAVSEGSSTPEVSENTQDTSSDETSEGSVDIDESSQENSEGSLPEEEEELAWNLILINGKNPVPDDFEPNLAEVVGEPMRGGAATYVDERIVEPLTQMLADARADGILPKITSAYRSEEDQIAVMEDYISDYMSEGMTREDAEAEAKKWVAQPGASEHHTGLAVDISTADWEAQGADIVWTWLEENCWKYGFILRYTEEWADITGTSPEPWHFRYVGTEHAKAITESGLPYETYYEQFIAE